MTCNSMVDPCVHMVEVVETCKRKEEEEVVTCIHKVVEENSKDNHQH